MPQTKTRGEMREMALRYADLDGYDGLEDVANAFLNARLARLYDFLIVAKGEDYYRTSVAISSIADQALYDFVTDFKISDFYRLTSFILDDGNQYHELDGIPNELLPQLLQRQNAGSAYSVFEYRRALRPTGIELRPAPTDTSLTLTLWYIPAFAELTDDSHKFDGVNGYEMLAELQTAMDLRIKEDEPITDLAGIHAEVKAEVMRVAGTRDQGRPARRKLTNPSRRRRGYRNWNEGY